MRTIERAERQQRDVISMRRPKIDSSFDTFEDLAPQLQLRLRFDASCESWADVMVQLHLTALQWWQKSAPATYEESSGV
jgi:hypothetical protein